MSFKRCRLSVSFKRCRDAEPSWRIGLTNPLSSLWPAAACQAEFSSAPKCSRFYAFMRLPALLLGWLFGVLDHYGSGDYRGRHGLCKAGREPSSRPGLPWLDGPSGPARFAGYAILIAGVTFLVRNSDIATMIISLLVGMIFPVHILCFREYGGERLSRLRLWWPCTPYSYRSLRLPTSKLYISHLLRRAFSSGLWL